MLDSSIQKNVLLFSGGLDSYLLYRLYQADVLLYCSCGHIYQRAELKAIDRLGLKDRVVVDDSLRLGSWERKEDGIIPLRNLLFSSVASRYGDNIWMGVLRGEINWDKSPEFFWTASTAMTHCYRQSYWSAGRIIKVSSPISHLTKAELISNALDAGIKPEEWKHTISCYDVGGRCGKCSSCFKRWVAHRLNNIDEKSFIQIDVNMLAEIQHKIENYVYKGDRLIETAAAIESRHDMLRFNVNQGYRKWIDFVVDRVKRGERYSGIHSLLS